MKTRITVYRHAQSMANAGLATETPDGIPLTRLGIQQAKCIARSIKEPPTMFITSPYLRAVQTAVYVRERFPDVPSEEWPIQELAYLSPEACRGTTKDQRARAMKALWDMCDPRHKEPGAESFAEFIGRVTTMITRLEAIADDQEQNNICVFGHGNFIRALAWCLLTHPHPESIGSMHAFRSFAQMFDVANGAALPLLYDGRWYVGTLATGHLSRGMVTF